MNLGLYMLELFQSEVTEAQLSQTYIGGRGKESSPEAYRIPGETLGGGWAAADALVVSGGLVPAPSPCSQVQRRPE